MKTFVALATLAVVAQAQNLGGLPACIQNCVSNMLGLSTSLGCNDPSANCLCSNVNFGYGVRDCSRQSCPADTDFTAANNYLVAYCAAGAGGSSVASTLPAVTAGTTIPPALASSLSAPASGASSAGASGASGVSGAAGAAASSAVATLGAATSVITEANGQVITSIVSASQTVFGFVTVVSSNGQAITSTFSNAAAAASNAASGASGSASSVASSASGALASASRSAASVTSSAGSAASSAASGASSAGGSASSRASSAAAGASSSASSAGLAPAVTMAAKPLVGLAGLAAIMLL